MIREDADSDAAGAEGGSGDRSAGGRSSAPKERVPLSPEKAWELLVERLSRREFTEREVLRYLKTRGVDAELGRSLVSRAVELGYLSNDRAARIWAREWAQRGQGALGIQRKLSLLKGVRVTLEQIQDWLSEGNRSPELERAVAWIERRYAGFREDEAARRRAFAALIRRGFSIDVAKAALRAAAAPGTEESEDA